MRRRFVMQSYNFFSTYLYEKEAIILKYITNIDLYPCISVN